MSSYLRSARYLSGACSLIGLFAANAVHAQVVIGQNFSGNAFSEGVGVTPPDTDGAVGLSHYVEFTNGKFAIFNKSNGSLATAKISDTTFWQNAGLSITTGLSDTRILFDHASQRWFAVEITTAATGNSVLVARSNTSDPTAGWKATSYVANSGFGDYPTVGVNADGLYVATNNFTSSTGTFSGVSITSIPKSDLLAATPTATNKTTFVNPSASLGFTLQAAIDYGASNGHASILAADANFFSKVDRTNIFNVAGPGAATLGSTTVINVQTTSDPNLGHQPDGTRQLDNSDSRFSGTVYKVGNLLYGAHSISDPVTGFTDIRWSVFNEATNAVVQEGTIASPHFDYFYPSLSVNTFGEAIIGFTRSGDNTTGAAGDTSTYAVAGTTSGGLLNFGAPFVLHAGTVNNYHLLGGDGERWGDYSATSLDPTDPHSFWTVQEFAEASNSWSTRVTQLTFTATPEPGTWAMFIGMTVSGSLFLKRRKRIIR